MKRIKYALPDLPEMYDAVRLAGESHLFYFAREPGLPFPWLFFNCNDVFSPAADAECIPWDLVREVKTIYDTDGHSAVVEWVSARRKEKEESRVEVA